MNILFLTYQGDIAGSTNSISYLVKGLAQKGHNIYLGCRKESLLYKMVEGTNVHMIPMVFKSRFDLQNIKHIRHIVKKYSIQIINAQSSLDRYTSILARWFYKLPVKVVHTRRQKPESIGGFFQNWFYIKGTDKIIVISNELKEMFVGIGIPRDHLYVIHNGIPKERFNEVDDQQVGTLRKKFNISQEDVVIGCISRLKKQDQIIKALPYLDPSYKVFFAGIVPGQFDDIVRKLGILNQIIYAGSMTGDEVLNCYKLLDVNVLASTMDGFGLVLLEAMALSVPVVATNFGGIKDVVKEGFNGLLYEDNDVEELAKKIEMVIKNHALREYIIENGKKTVFEEFTFEKTIKNHETFFRDLINNQLW